MEANFTCDDCKQVIDTAYRLKPNYIGVTGYAVRGSDNTRVCYQCAATEEFNDLKREGKGGLYTTQKYSHGCDFYSVGDWTGTIKIECYNVRFSWHNFAGDKGRLDMHFDFDGSVWLATRIGDQDFTRVRRTKKKVSA